MLILPLNFKTTLVCLRVAIEETLNLYLTVLRLTRITNELIRRKYSRVFDFSLLVEDKTAK